METILAMLVSCLMKMMQMQNVLKYLKMNELSISHIHHHLYEHHTMKLRIRLLKAR